MLGKKSFVGVDFGHHTIKAAFAERSAQGWKITKAGWVPTPPDCIKEGILINPEPVAAALKALLRHTGIQAKNAVLSVQGSTVVVRTVRMPKMSESVLRKSIRFEAGRYVPTSVEEAFIEFEILGDAEDGQMDVLIVAAPKDFVESRVVAAQMAGLEVDTVDVSPFAAYRSLVETDDSKAWDLETFALIDLGSGANTVSVISEGQFAMTRTITNGHGAALTEALRTFFDLSIEDAEAGKTALDVKELLDEEPQENPPLRVLHPYLDELVREIRRSLNYYESQSVDGQAPKPIKSIVLTGGGAKLTGIGDYLANKLGLPVTTMGAFENPRVINQTPHDFGAGHEFSVVAGLAMRPTMKAA